MFIPSAVKSGVVLLVKNRGPEKPGPGRTGTRKNRDRENRGPGWPTIHCGLDVEALPDPSRYDCASGPDPTDRGPGRRIAFRRPGGWRVHRHILRDHQRAETIVQGCRIGAGYGPDLRTR